MSRLAVKGMQIPKGVEVKLDGCKISLKGPKGTFSFELTEGVQVKVEHNAVFVTEGESLKEYAYVGLEHARIKSGIEGVFKGYEKRLELIGVGYRAQVKGHVVDLSLGFSHPVQVSIPHGIQVMIEKNVLIIITGVDKQLVGQFAATVRAQKKPEPYKGKGVRYVGEYVRKKAGKAAKAK